MERRLIPDDFGDSPEKKMAMLRGVSGAEVMQFSK